MNIKQISLYFAGILLLLAGNRNLWEKLLEAREFERTQKELSEANRGIEKRFETQRLEYDSISGKWKNPQFYFQTISLGNTNFKALRKKINKIEQNDDENASASS